MSSSGLYPRRTWTAWRFPKLGVNNRYQLMSLIIALRAEGKPGRRS
ncbi:MAG: hypothetical protein WAU81_00510 [Candidatus Aminicenantales bacterium]